MNLNYHFEMPLMDEATNIGWLSITGNFVEVNGQLDNYGIHSITYIDKARRHETEDIKELFLFICKTHSFIDVTDCIKNVYEKVKDGFTDFAPEQDVINEHEYCEDIHD